MPELRLRAMPVGFAFNDEEAASLHMAHWAEISAGLNMTSKKRMNKKVYVEYCFI